MCKSKLRNDGFNKSLHFLFTPTAIWVRGGGRGDVLGMQSRTCLPASPPPGALGRADGGKWIIASFSRVCGRGDHFKEEAVVNPV